MRIIWWAVLVLLIAGAALVFEWGGDMDQEAEPVSPWVDGSARAEPRWVSAIQAADRVDLLWTGVPGALGYVLWRSEGEGEDFAPLASVRDTSYADLAYEGAAGRFCYRLTALDPEFDLSGFSEDKCVEFLSSR